MSYLNELGIVCSLGRTKKEVFESLTVNSDREYLTPWGLSVEGDKTFICGQVELDEELSSQMRDCALGLQSKNNQLALMAYQQIKDTYQELTSSIPASRIAVVLGTSTSGIREGELAKATYKDNAAWPDDYDYSIQEMVSPADFIAHVSGAQGPVYSISTACSSSAKALASGRALLDSGLVDVVICGGVDTLSNLPNNGFNSLESVAETYCNPLAAERDGINIGEGAALFLMSKTEASIKLCGVGETSDAHHISAPHPEGLGAQAAMDAALIDADLTASDIDYINLHGTATPKNDEMETRAVANLFGLQTPCSSTKRFTGHTLGAAGAIEAGVLWLLLSQANENNLIPKNKSDFGLDPNLDRIAVSHGQMLEKLDFCLSNSFAFGGNNISVILGKV